MNKNLLELCLSPDLGGLELYVQKCSHELCDAFSLTTVIAKNSKLKEYLKDSTTHCLKRKSSFSLITAYKLAKIIDNQKIDIVHLHWTKDLPIAVFAKILSKKKPKLIQTRHMTMTRFKDDFYHKFLYKNLDCIICVTKAVEKQINTFIPKAVRPKTKTIYLGVDEKIILSQEALHNFRQSLGLQNEFIVSIVGRINDFKGQHLLIKAMHLLKEKKLNIKAFIVGHAMDEKYLQNLKKEVNSLKLTQDVIFTGFTKEVDNYMQLSDVVVMASKNETFGLVTVEAMANQTAVIGANSGGVLEIIDDKKTGLLFESQNPQDLAQKIEILYNDEKLKTTLAHNGFHRASEAFNSKQQFDKLTEYVHNEVLND